MLDAKFVTEDGQKKEYRTWNNVSIILDTVLFLIILYGRI